MGIHLRLGGDDWGIIFTQQAYSVVPEVYRKPFRGMIKSHSETYSEFAFRLSTQLPVR